jgi:hypothetical protein
MSHYLWIWSLVSGLAQPTPALDAPDAAWNYVGLYATQAECQAAASQLKSTRFICSPRKPLHGCG